MLDYLNRVKKYLLIFELFIIIFFTVYSLNPWNLKNNILQSLKSTKKYSEGDSFINSIEIEILLVALGLGAGIKNGEWLLEGSFFILGMVEIC